MDKLTSRPFCETLHDTCTFKSLSCGKYIFPFSLVLYFNSINIIHNIGLSNHFNTSYHLSTTHSLHHTASHNRLWITLSHSSHTFVLGISISHYSPHPCLRVIPLILRSQNSKIFKNFHGLALFQRKNSKKYSGRPHNRCFHSLQVPGSQRDLEFQLLFCAGDLHLRLLMSLAHLYRWLLFHRTPRQSSAL